MSKLADSSFSLQFLSFIHLACSPINHFVPGWQEKLAPPASPLLLSGISLWDHSFFPSGRTWHLFLCYLCFVELAPSLAHLTLPSAHHLARPPTWSLPANSVEPRVGGLQPLCFFMYYCTSLISCSSSILTIFRNVILIQIWLGENAFSLQSKFEAPQKRGFPLWEEGGRAGGSK